jgi:hypothetical protein
LDAVNTDNLSDDVTAKDITEAAAIVQEEDGPAAIVEDIPSEDPVKAAITDVASEEKDAKDSEEEFLVAQEEVAAVD